jgi:hypothetical protein
MSGYPCQFNGHSRLAYALTWLVLSAAPCHTQLNDGEITCTSSYTTGRTDFSLEGPFCDFSASHTADCSVGRLLCGPIPPSACLSYFPSSVQSRRQRLGTGVESVLKILPSLEFDEISPGRWCRFHPLISLAGQEELMRILGGPHKETRLYSAMGSAPRLGSVPASFSPVSQVTSIERTSLSWVREKKNWRSRWAWPQSWRTGRDRDRPSSMPMPLCCVSSLPYHLSAKKPTFLT